MTTAHYSFYSTSVGKKVVMAVTGLIAFSFVVVHLLGNLQIYQGPEAMIRYQRFLHSLGGGLWVFRVGLIVAILLHIVASTQLTLQSMDARPLGYRRYRYRETTYAARTMWWGGPLIGLYVIYHVMHLTFGSVHPSFEDNVYNNVVTGFQVPWVSGVYIVAMVLLGFHLTHGLWSMLQTTGINHPKWNRLRRGFALTLGVGIAAGYISIPVSVLAGWITPI